VTSLCFPALSHRLSGLSAHLDTPCWAPFSQSICFSCDTCDSCSACPGATAPTMVRRDAEMDPPGRFWREKKKTLLNTLLNRSFSGCDTLLNALLKEHGNSPSGLLKNSALVKPQTEREGSVLLRKGQGKVTESNSVSESAGRLEPSPHLSPLS
jgi:hypothetical protein